MKRSKLGASSATIGIILGCLILLAGIGILSVGYTDVGGLWTKYIAFQSNIVDATIAQNPILVGNEYIVTIVNKATELFSKVPQNYKLGVFGGAFVLIGTYAMIEGLFCSRKKAKKAYLSFAIVDSLIFLVLSTLAVLFGIGGAELIPLIVIVGVAVLHGALFPAFKFIGRASFFKRLSQSSGKKVLTKAKVLPANGASHRSKDRKKAEKKNKIKLTRKQKKLAKLAKQKGGEVGKNGKVLSKPISINTKKPGQSIGTKVNSGVQITGGQIAKPKKDNSTKKKGLVKKTKKK